MSEDIFKKLKKPFPAKEIKWRIGATNNDKSKGIALAYITSRAVMDRLDKVVGGINWQDEITSLENGKTMCKLSVRINDEWITKTGVAGETNIEAAKGGASDALKRAAVKFGIARYLYHLPTTWVDLDKYNNIKNPPNLPSWALPEGDKSNSKQQKKSSKSSNEQSKKSKSKRSKQISKLVNGENKSEKIKVVKSCCKRNNVKKVDGLEESTYQELIKTLKSKNLVQKALKEIS